MYQQPEDIRTHFLSSLTIKEMTEMVTFRTLGFRSKQKFNSPFYTVFIMMMMMILIIIIVVTSIVPVLGH